MSIKNPLKQEELTIRFAGDSGDGMQVTGNQFTNETALAGNDFATFPDFPAEIRAPVGTTFGVSAFQIRFGQKQVLTEGDDVDILVALNPAALKTNLETVKDKGLLIVNSSSFNKKNLQKAKYVENPLEDNTLSNYSVMKLDIEKYTLEAVADCGVTNREAHRCKNFWALGLILWICNLDRANVLRWMSTKFKRTANLLDANTAALNAGHIFAEASEISHSYPRFIVKEADKPAGKYRDVSGTEALCLGLIAGASLNEVAMTYCSYPITPASSMLHFLSALNEPGINTFQAEDEIAAISAAIGASYAGNIGITGTSGPGMALKGEALGLAIACELPLVVVNAQRGGPSTGLPTKTEQSDLYQAVLGRNADSPLIVVASRSASDCFECAKQAVYLAIKYMTPVILLTDGYLANAAEPWSIPDLGTTTLRKKSMPEPSTFKPYERDPTSHSRAWVPPGTPNLRHRIGGIERSSLDGNISYEPKNHQIMTNERAAKINAVQNDIQDEILIFGSNDSEILLIGWGSTYGAINSAVSNLRKEGNDIAYIHLRHISPFAKNLETLISSFSKILVPELNSGQLASLLRAHFPMQISQLNKVEGQPFKVRELEESILNLMRST